MEDWACQGSYGDFLRCAKENLELATKELNGSIVSIFLKIYDPIYSL